MRSIETEQLRNIYNYFTFEQARLFSGFIEARLPGCNESLKILCDKKLLKKSSVLGGYYYNTSGKFEDAVLEELERRQGGNEMPVL